MVPDSSLERPHVNEREQALRRMRREWTWETDANGRIVQVDEVYTHLAGAPAQTGKALWTLFGSGPPETYAAGAIDHKLATRRRFSNLVCDGFLPTVGAANFELSGEPLFAEDGTFRGYLGVAQLLLHNIQGSENTGYKRFHSLVEDSLQGIMVHIDMKPVYANQRFAEIYGYASPAEILALPSTLSLHPVASRTDQIELNHRRWNEENVPTDYETPGLCKDGSTIMLRILIKKLDWGGQRATQAVVIDVTEARRTADELARYREHLEELVEARTAELATAQQALLRQERLATIGQLVGTVSHELRTPLGTIVASLEPVRSAIDQHHRDAGRALARIDRSISRCTRIIDELLSYTQSREPVPTRLRLGPWLARLADEHPTDGVEIELDVDPDLELHADEALLDQALQHLLLNACQAMAGAGSAERRVTIHARARDEDVEIAVTDTGPGIPDDDRESVFEPLFSTKGFGVGLGLAHVQDVAERHGGSVRIQSAEGEGACLVLSLPGGSQGVPRREARRR